MPGLEIHNGVEHEWLQTGSSTPSSASSSIDEGSSGHTTAGFEGPEKRLEVDFEMPDEPSMGLRLLPRPIWDEVVASVNGVILNELHNEHFDAYLISESSMFVYPYRVIMLTCGTTTLLNALPKILEAAEQCNLKAHWVQFSRKNFTFPHAQIAPHRSFDDECKVLKQRFSKGSPYMMGPLDCDHWYAYIADYIDRSRCVEQDQLLTLYMHDMDPSVAKLFFYGDRRGNAEQVTDMAGISSIIPGAVVQGHCFDGCGYSVNALVGEAYFTMHITPEDHCSYASFETNLKTPDLLALVRKVLALFRPRRAQSVVMYDADSEFGHSSKANKHATDVDNYIVKHRTMCECEPGYKVVVTNYRAAQ